MNNFNEFNKYKVWSPTFMEREDDYDCFDIFCLSSVEAAKKHVEHNLSWATDWFYLNRSNVRHIKVITKNTSNGDTIEHEVKLSLVINSNIFSSKVIEQ